MAKRSNLWGAAALHAFSVAARSQMRRHQRAVSQAMKHLSTPVKVPKAAALPKVLKSLHKPLKAVKPLKLPSAQQVARMTLRAAPTLRPQARTPSADLDEPGWTLGQVSTADGTRRFRLYRPAGAAPGAALPLMVLLHGCLQDSAGFARSTQMHALAARLHFGVLYPEQDRSANSQACWNWFDTRAGGRADSELRLLDALLDHVSGICAIDPQRMAVAGLSAGAAMAALWAARSPRRFAAVAMHSGVAPGQASSTATALSAMRGRQIALPLARAPGTLPPLLVIHGRNDTVVAPCNGRQAAELWAQAGRAREGAAVLRRRGARHAMTETDFKRGQRLVASLCEIDDLGHAWSGGAPNIEYSDPAGPGASNLIWTFAARAFSARVGLRDTVKA